MAKTLTGGASIPYGPTLPVASISADGSLFYKTDDVGSPQGLYLFGFISDSNSGALGPQVGQGWSQANSPGLFVFKGGDTMTGALTVPAFLKITQTAGPQRLLIGNQDSGGINRPGLIVGYNGVISIGYGTSWSGNGGTLTAGLQIDPAGLASGLIWQGSQVWHAANDGIGSGLDADLLRGYALSSAATANTVVLRDSAGYLYGQYFHQGSANNENPAISQVMVTTGADGFMRKASLAHLAAALAPGATGTWNINITGSAATAGTATYATTAGSATTAGTATTATNVAWTGITGLPNAVQTFAGQPTANFTTYARPSLFYDFSNIAVPSATPTQFQQFSLTGFDGYTTGDLGSYQVGLTAMGVSGRGFQLTANWNFEEVAPSGGLRYRVNDDTGTTGAWGPLRTIWDQGNLTSLSQLTNDSGFATSAALGNYVLKTTDSMSGQLTVERLVVGMTSAPAAGGMNIAGNITGFGYVSVTGNIQSAGGNVIATTGSIVANSGHVSAGDGAGGTGIIRMRASGSGNSGYVEFIGSNGIRAGYIGNTGTTGSQDAGGINYVAGFHDFQGNTTTYGNITATGNVTAYASDGRLKKNVTVIENAVEKVLSLGGYSYDWDAVKCAEVGFTPANEHEHGLIAQEVQKVMPDAVAPAPFNDKYLTVRYERIVALLTAAMGEQQQQIEALKRRLELLEG